MCSLCTLSLLWLRRNAQCVFDSCGVVPPHPFRWNVSVQCSTGFLVRVLLLNKKKSSLFYFLDCSSTTASILHDVNAWINCPLHSVCGYTCVYVWVLACIYFLYNSVLYIVCVGVIGCRVGCTHALCIRSVALRGAVLYNNLIF